MAKDRGRQFTSESARNVSKEQSAYDQLRRAIISGELKPGERLVPAEIGEQLGISSMPVRNAMMRLEAERLITRAPHREFIVTEYSAQEIHDVNQTLGALEAFAARLASLKMTESKLAELRQLVGEAEKHLVSGHIESLMDTNRAFHEALYAQSGNEQLQEVMLLLRNREARYRARYYYARTEVPEQMVQEHREIISALEKGDHEGAEQLLRRYSEEMGAGLVRLVHGERQ